MKKCECKCSTCQSACANKPGWFMPGEAEKAAELLGITLEELFKTKLGVDWWEGDEPVFCLSPANIDMNPGEEFPGDPRGQCVFFKDGLCEIHEAKPYECAVYDCKKSTKYWSEDVKIPIKTAWESYQKQIENLLGREAETSSYSFLDMMF